MAGHARAGLRLLAGALIAAAAASLRTSPSGPASETRLSLSETDLSRPELSLAEAQGETPVFVDAFLDAGEGAAFVVLSTNSLHNREPLYDELVTSEWLCRWQGKSPEEATQLARIWSQRELRPARPRWTDAPAHDAHRHTLVVNCSLPDGVAEESGELPSLSLAAVRGGERRYERSGIRVRRQSLFNRSETALCTMAIENSSASASLPNWVRYHLNTGFDQILVYIEDRDPSWARRLLHEFLGEGRVQLVHFYFGALSEKQTWEMQQAQEQHCLYQAKGRVSWLGHSDIDEYFQVMRPGGSLKDLLKEVSRKTESGRPAAVVVRSSFWYVNSPEALSDRQVVPCDMTCKSQSYRKQRQKLIMSPDLVQYFSVHTLTRYEGAVYAASPDGDIRLNHFKANFKANPYEVEGPCREDLSFQQACRDALASPLDGLKVGN